ncbi:hypothetical protein GGP41_005566 [Bipolaris sorokiniana]|uniref:Rab-GAP TBC domain-containing protein n=2 Tax=Cochliobolus sativus TaxID=45130 RepID=A0A8H6DU58_COCSA|nr:uncharacterized protein COCSADRAFT_331840 [Bipolaris sorokiniana ND90Pr]EMD63805.1 hypothetical protein COCSADRAFT_331840 [Bipolaris sorokiniana ND90Pr]KAF5848162.1 hypothetical protein GGP41_005566 [Bipolaris sorokiniana]
MSDEAVNPSSHAAVEPYEASNPLAPVLSNPQSALSVKGTASRSWLANVRRPRTSPGPRAFSLKRTPPHGDDDDRRDSALASSNGTIVNEPPSPRSLRRTPSLPAIVIHDERSSRTEHAHDEDDAAFSRLECIIPTGGFDDISSDALISFSKRGSMMLGGKRANRKSRHMDLLVEGAPTPSAPQRQEEEVVKEAEEEEEEEQAESQEQTQRESQEQPQPTSTQMQQESPQPPLPTARLLSPRATSRVSGRSRSISHRVLSTDEMTLSRKVRCMYMHGNESAVNWDAPEEDSRSIQNSYRGNSSVNNAAMEVIEDDSSLMSSRRGSVIVKEPTEAAGGLEDWADLEGGEVDRYGFIIPKRSRSKSNSEGIDGPDEPHMQRVTTTLQLLSEEPRRRRLGRSVSRAPSTKSGGPRAGSLKRRFSGRSSRPARSIFSGKTSDSRTTFKPLRHAANKLPHNRDRRLRDEASDMLKLPPGLAEVAEQKEGGRAARAMKAKEIERNEKWRKMAKIIKAGADKGGMLFEFETKDPKVISRTWKGIPDRWRATAWYSFLAASANADADSPTEEELIVSFYELQEEGSADDVQIDVDVPRTINRHIMFRRRYRGGQRLLFRVLHAMSLYLPETGYVQGMASLAATLLCYYEEDRAFVMLVRLWQLRGMERLYEAGFEGLMEALDDFELNWLRGGDIAQKLTDLGITSTAYGTRWYLTLFNYSLPFPAQLRVWDVFMLLGDKSHATTPGSKFSADMDVLHATSAALIDATREILLDSDFENAMKVLTSWIPIKDEDLLMRVAKAEYKMRKKRANA